MTKVLLISNKSDLTSDFIVKRLNEQNIDFYRFNTEELGKSCLIALDFEKEQYFLRDKFLRKTFNLKEFNSVYFRRPELPIIDSSDLSDGELLFLKHEYYFTLEGVYKLLKDAFWISPVYAIREAENKIYQLELAKLLGFHIPNSIITNDFQASVSFFDYNQKDCIVKPIKSGLIEENGNSKIVFTSVLNQRPNNKEKIEFSPNFLQNRIHKKYDIRATIVGETVFAVAIISQDREETQTDWRRGENILEHRPIQLPEEIEKKCIQILRKLNLQFGAIDLILDINDNYIFLEINPNGQWAWIEKVVGYKISNEIVNLLKHGNHQKN